MKLTNPLLIFFLLFLLSSCRTSKKSIYVNNMVVDSIYTSTPIKPLRIQAGDRLRIVVGARSAELAVPFNPNGSGYNIDDKGAVSAGLASNHVKGYLVNQEGEISFPVLGNLNVQGFTLQEVKKLIEQELIDQRFLQAPSVLVELENLRINVMGEVNKVGIIDVPDGKITLFDAISAAGGMTSNGLATEVGVIREVNGHRQFIAVNVESEGVFHSPAYYLQQNDIVYVKPRGRRLSPNEEANFRYVSVGVGLMSLIVSFLVLIIK